MKISCLILDDEDLGIKVLEHYLLQEPDIGSLVAFNSPISALEYIEEHRPQLIFLDIQMPEMTGLQIAEKIADTNAVVVFVTAYAEYALDAYNLDVVDYLLKPFDKERFQKTFEKAKGFIEFKAAAEEDQDGFYIKHNGLQKFVRFNDILFVEGMKQYAKIITGSERYIVQDTLQNLEELLVGNFKRVHKSYIANMDKAEKLAKRKLLIAGREIPVSRTVHLLG